MAGDSSSILTAARRLNEARFALDSALASLVAQLPEDERAEFGDSDVEGFAFNMGMAGGFDRQTLATQGLHRFGGNGVAFFDTNGSCGAVAPELGGEAM